MKKYFYRFAAMGIAILIMTSCGGNNKGESSNEDNQEDVPEIEVADATVEETPVEPEEEGFKLPLTFTAERLTPYGGGRKLPLDTPISDEENYTKDVYVFHLLANGKYTGTHNQSISNWRTDHKWESLDPVTFEGKWTTTSRTIGENNQKVYKLRVDQGYLDGEFFVPDNFEYIWLGGDEWEDDNTNPEYAVQITNVKQE